MFLTMTEQSGKITTLNQLVILLMSPKMAVDFPSYKAILLANGLLIVYQNSLVLFGKGSFQAVTSQHVLLT